MNAILQSEQQKVGILGKRWTREENKLLKRYYKDKGPKYLSEKLGRSCDSVRLQAIKFGLKYHVRKWEVWEDRFLKRHYHKKSNASLGRTLKRSVTAIRCRAVGLNLTNPNPKNWSEEEDKILRELYPNRSFSVDYIAKCVNRTTGAVNKRATRLKILRKGHKWTKDEQQYFKKNWKSKSYKEIAQYLNISYDVVLYHSINLGLRKRSAGRPWTEKEKEFVRRNYNVIPRREIAAKLNRSMLVVSNLAGKLGLRNPPPRPWSEKDKNFLKKNYGILSPEKIAAKLGRTKNGVIYAASLYL